jgi:hypothetical protein
MDEEEMDIAHNISEKFQECVVKLGAVLLTGLTPDQQQYILTKAHDEFRFWRIEDELTLQEEKNGNRT